MYPQLASIHYTLTLLILVLGTAAVVRGVILFAHRRVLGYRVDTALCWLLLATAGLAGVEALLGLILLAAGARPFDPRHYLWGLAVLGAIPLAASFVRRARVLRNVVVLALGAAVVVVTAVMALLTGCPFLGGCPH